MADGSLAPADPYTLEFTAEVVDHVDGGVVLSETYFYPEGGGQPPDRGTVDGVAVTDVQTVEGRVVHSLAEPLAAAEGAAVPCAVDPAFRTYCMRAHTASHVLYGAGRRLFNDFGYGGFGITAGDAGGGTADEAGESDDPGSGGKVRVDFRTPSAIDDDALVELERLTNRAVWDSLDVSWRTVDAEAALADDEVAFNTKTEEGVTGDTVRLVEIEGWDLAACGGTHVTNTREIGPVTLLDRSNPGEGLTRIEFAVGPRAIRRRAEDSRAALAAARALDASVADLPEAVARLREEREQLADEREALSERYAAARLEALAGDAVERNGRRWIAGTVEGLDANALADRVRDLAGDRAAVVALVNEDGALAVGTDGEVDAGEVVADVTDAFGGGGGGSPTVAQGGGIGADPEDVVAFLRGED